MSIKSIFVTSLSTPSTPIPSTPIPSISRHSIFSPLNVAKATLMTTAALLISLASFDVWSQAGGMQGYDKNIKAIEPSSVSYSVGLAGDMAPTISRLILAESQGVRNSKLSPKGKYVAYVSGLTGKLQLWVQPADGGQARQLTFGSGVRNYAWAPSGSHILYSSDNNGNEQESYYLLNVEAFTEKEVLPAVEGGFRVFGGFVDETTILFTSTERNKLDFDLYLTNLKTGETTMIYEGRMGLYISSVSPDGKWAVMKESVGEDSDIVYLFDLQNRSLKTISAPNRRANHTRAGIAWTKDSSGFYFATNAQQEYINLAFYDIDKGIKKLDQVPHDVEQIRLCQDDRYLAYTLNIEGFSQLQVKEIKSGTMLKAGGLPEGILRIDCGVGATQLLVESKSSDDPGSLYLWDFSDTAEVLFEAGLAGVPKNSIVKPKSIRIEARDGVMLQGLLYLPQSKQETPPPALFRVHGGPTSQSRPYFDAMTQYLVNHGIAVFKPNVRGSTGFGHTYVTLDDREKRLDSVRDLVDMHEYLSGKEIIDGKNVAVAGGSYGGYAVNAVLANYPGYFAAGVSLFGVADWVTALEVASPMLKASDIIEYGDIKDPKWLAFYQQYSPIRQAQNINVPVLYSHGVMDPRIDIVETEIMVKTLRNNGIEAPFIRIPDEGHGWNKRENRMFYALEEVKFLKRVLNAQ